MQVAKNTAVHVSSQCKIQFLILIPINSG